MAEKKYPILPDWLRSKIKALVDQDFKNDQILEKVRKDSSAYVSKDVELKRCIAGIKASRTKEKRALEKANVISVFTAGSKDSKPMGNLKTEFGKFKKDPRQRFRVQLRRHRAKEIKALLAIPERVNLDIFNREVWWFESETRLDGENIKGELLGTAPIESERIERLQNALSAGNLELHGNYTWGSGTNIYGPMIKSDSAKLENVRKAIEVLNDSSLDSFSQAEEISKLLGFGPNISTGLVMMFHPSDFAIYNQKSKKAIEMLGGEAGNLESFEKHAEQLKNNLGAEDFLELDWFLYLIAEGVIRILPDEDDLSSKIKRWQQQQISQERIKVRRESEKEARDLLSEKAGHFEKDELRQFFKLINRDYWKGKLQNSRFQMAYVGKNVNEMVGQLQIVNEWISRFWQASESELRDIFDEFYDLRPIKNAGTAFPSMILYLRNPSQFNLCFKKMEAGLSKLTGFSGKGYSGAHYFNYNDKVKELRDKHELVPQEIDIILTVSDTDPPVSSESPFSQKTFSLLQGLHKNPNLAFYNNKKEDFTASLIQPFQNLLGKVGENLSPMMTEYLELKKNVFSRIPKNDYGKGGAWDFYWGAFYPKGGKRTEDAQLFLWIHQNRLEFGFYIGEYGSEQRKRFLKNCNDNYKTLLNILKGSAIGPNLKFGGHEYLYGDREEVDENKTILSLEEWLKNPSETGIHAAVYMSKNDVLERSATDLVEEIRNTYVSLFPFVLLATLDNPMPAIGDYLEISEPQPSNPEYALTRCAEDTGFSEAILAQWSRALDRKGQAIIYGPPGTGKTFVAEHLARHVIGGGDGFQDLVQFHPAYAYEDFIQGIRPKTKDDGQLDYPVVAGRFLEFCRKASNCIGRCVLIIDEINRANLARVFGELMYLLEYRDQQIPLASGGYLRIPANVRIIGTMNTADRSIALVDHALRRRFAFLSLYPNYEILRSYHKDTEFDVDPLIKVLENLNRQIGDRHYEVGITFFLRKDLTTHIEDIWRMEIEPYLEEYFFDQADKVDEFRWEKVGKEIIQ